MKRYASIDTAKGFAILVMSLIHVLSQQLAGYNHDLFLPILNAVTPMALLSISPLALMAGWGSFFTFLTCVTTTLRMLSVADYKRSELHRVVESRIVIGVLILGLEKIVYFYRSSKRFENGKFTVPTIGLRYHSETTDSIVFISIIISIILLFFLSIPQLAKPKLIIGFFALLALVTLYYSDDINLKCEELYIQFANNENHILRLLISKVCRGRFKFSQSLSFGSAGVLYGSFLYAEIPLKKLRIATAIITTVLLSFFIGFLIKDWTFLLEFVSENVRFELQYFNLAGQCVVFHILVRNIDYGPPARKLLIRKYTVWLRRYGIVSLTLYTMGVYLQDWLMEYLLPYWGPPMIQQGGSVELVWSFIQIYYLFFLVMVMWEIVLRLWEKIDYIFSLEWFFSLVSHIFFGKRSAMIGSDNILYKPCRLEIESMSKDPINQTEKIATEFKIKRKKLEKYPLVPVR